MHDIDPQPVVTEAVSAPGDESIARRPVEPSGGRTARAKVFGALVVGGMAGAAILGPLTAAAATPTPATTTTTSTTITRTTTSVDADSGHAGGPGGHVEAVSDTSVVAKAIGISEADLKTALAGGQTVAAVAKAHNVPLQTVIDALVADGTSELAAGVAAGTITQAQADAQKASILQRATDQANGTFSGGRP